MLCVFIPFVYVFTLMQEARLFFSYQLSNFVMITIIDKMKDIVEHVIENTCKPCNGVLSSFSIFIPFLSSISFEIIFALPFSSISVIISLYSNRK